MGYFEAFAHMVRNNDKRLKMAPLSNISAMDIKGTNGFVTFGVPTEIVHDLMDEKKNFVGGFLIVPQEAVDEFKALQDTIKNSGLKF